jgi:hypothetical protein
MEKQMNKEAWDEQVREEELAEEQERATQLLAGCGFTLPVGAVVTDEPAA